MTEDRIREILSGIEVRQNLSRLRQDIKENGREGMAALKNMMKENQESWIGLLKNEDAKIRKGAALLLGEMGMAEYLDAIYEALEREKQMFVKSSYLKAIADFDYREYLDKMKERLKKLASEELTAENKKHIAEEMRILSELIIKAEGIVTHFFQGEHIESEIILTANRLYRENLMRLLAENAGVSEEQIRLLPAGLRFRTDVLDQVLPIRIYQELFFLVPGMKTCERDAVTAAETISSSALVEFLEERHDGKAPFYFRLEVKKKAASDRDRDFVKKVSAELERLTCRKLINSPSSYEMEIRFIENKEGRYNVPLKLCTIEDNRFAYRKEVIAAGIKPVNAALLVELARPYMEENARVLDPFCGVGTMLIERQKAVKGNTAYGIDIMGDAIEAARKNTEEAGQIIHYINRDFFDFTHEYVFDEIFTDMPFALGRTTEEEVLELHDRFLDRAKAHLTKEGTIIMYTHNPDYVHRTARNKGYRVLKSFPISQKEGTQLLVLR